MKKFLAIWLAALFLLAPVRAHAQIGGSINGGGGSGGSVAIGSVTGLGTGVATALGVNVGSAGAPVVLNGALGTPSSGTATNLSGTAASLNIGGNAATATALAANPAACGAGEFVNDIAANGTLTCATPAGGSFATAVAAKNNADQSLSSTTTTVKILFQTEDLDSSSAFATSTFTAPATGCYLASYTLFFTGSPTRVITEFEVNGAAAFQIEQRTLALSVFNANDTRIICVTSGQTIEVWGAMQGTTPSVQGTGAGVSSFSVVRVS